MYRNACDVIARAEAKTKAPFLQTEQLLEDSNEDKEEEEGNNVEEHNAGVLKEKNLKLRV
ncbi:hypothetical protein J4E91_006562 [Alternaria rosae]|nr:hypothetical protein J4E91_006562 [Alternaria rosae]